MKIAWNMFYDNFKQFLNKNKFLVAVFVLVMVVGIVTVPRIFAVLQPVRSVEIFSEKLDYNSKEPGAWKVTKSAKWTSKGEAEITFDVDSIMKTNNKDTDVLLVLDISGSMDGDKLNRVKTDSIELIESLLSDNKNKVGLISFDSTSEIISDFTNDKDVLINNINNLGTKGCTNYYQALVNVDSVLKDYVKENDKDCVVLFLTDGYPNEETPNEEVEYDYLKKQYPFVTINGIQYEMGESILEPIKKVSDNQFIANMDTLNNVLFEASIIPVTYDNFEIVDYIDTNYFYVENSNNIKVNRGEFVFDKSNQKITWTMNGYRSGSKAKMTIKAKLKEDNISQDSNFPTNKSEEIKSKIEDTVEDVVSTKTPVLASKYKVIYDANVPSGCKVSGVIPDEKSYSVFDTVELNNSVLNCEEYQFRGWEIVTKGVVSINDDYFTMPGEDVVIRALWSKLSLNKSMDGEVKEYIPATLENYRYGKTYGLHKYKSSITDIVFQDSMSSIGGAIDVLDISEEKNKGILLYIVPNVDDSTTYTAYIQGDGRVVANSDSSWLFAYFRKLKSIRGLEFFDTSQVTSFNYTFVGCESLVELELNNFDTSNVTNMGCMFWECSSLTELDLSSFDTSKVENMYSMFSACSNLKDLNVNVLDTTNVVDMHSMFAKCSGLTSLDLSNFDVSKVKYMYSMFQGCDGLTNLDLSNFDTSNVTNMESMFYSCDGLINLNLSNFDTQKVTNMYQMFMGCSSLIQLDLTSFKTMNVTNMGSMFWKCSSLTSLNLSSFDVSNVTNMYWMFLECSSLTSLDLTSFNPLNVTDTGKMFSGCSSLEYITFGDFGASKNLNMESMFYDCSSLISLDLSGFDTSSVTTMSNVFSNCSNLTSLNISSFDTTNVTDMSAMFSGCSSLISLGLGSFDTSNVTTMGVMFQKCSNISNLDLNNFDTSSVTNMYSMFQGCESLKSLYISNFDTKSVTTTNSMFSGCSSLTGLDLSNFNTLMVTSMESMFQSCSSLISLDLSNFNTKSVTTMKSMFQGCLVLNSLVISSFDTSMVTNMSNMFSSCINLTSLNLSSFDTSKVTTMQSMFSSCRSLTSLDLSNLDTSNVTNMSSMFSNCSSLKNLDLSNFDTSSTTDMTYIFSSSTLLNTSITISNRLSRYSSMFYMAATEEGAQITVNYTEAVADVIDDYIATKSTRSNVVKGELVTI